MTSHLRLIKFTGDSDVCAGYTWLTTQTQAISLSSPVSMLLRESAAWQMTGRIWADLGSAGDLSSPAGFWLPFPSSFISLLPSCLIICVGEWMGGSAHPCSCLSSTLNLFAIKSWKIGPDGASGKEVACQCRRHKRHGFDPWVGKISWRRKWQPTPVSLLGKSHG